MIYKKVTYLTLFLTTMFLFYSCILFKKATVNRTIPPVGITIPPVKQDTLKKINKPRPYKEVITSNAITNKGLFSVHKVEDRYYFEIPDSLLDKEILIVNRVVKAAADWRKEDFGYAGDKIVENVVLFTKGMNNKLLIRRMLYYQMATDSSDNGMYRSFVNSNLRPIVAVFDIKAFSIDSSSSVIDMTDYINTDNDILFFDSNFKKKVGLGAIQPDKSYIQSISSFRLNVEVRTTKTYINEATLNTYELNSSWILLPTKLMKPRYLDSRVGYFGRYSWDFDVPQGVRPVWKIIRWRLEPKVEDAERYKRGELVEPQTPIVYYIDPATPKKWVPYLIQGVNDWKTAFEKAGFKNAIYAMEAPKNDPQWSIEDARHNAIVYKAAILSNASGPTVTDPRTGEILETHINWYHNVMEILHDWYMIQAGPSDPKARKMIFDDSLMGQLIRFVCSHEVGHTLGLAHNFGASSTIPVEKLRDKKWVEENGFCPSIMDYARFNYVAQPEDSISEKGLLPRIGIYDKWAIEWGYKWLPDFKSKEEEKTYLNKWIIDRTSTDKRLWFGNESTPDPRCQSEDIGDNAMKAGEYGIRNLKKVMSQLIEWTKEPNADYESLSKMKDGVIAQFRRYLFHVANNIGGIMFTSKTVEEKGGEIAFVSKESQLEGIKFLQRELFDTPEWIMDKTLFSLIGGYSFNEPIILQREIMNNITSQKTISNLLHFEANYPDSAYTITQLFDDLQAAIFREVKTVRQIDFYRRNLQKVYVERLIALLNPQNSDNPFDGSSGSWNTKTDIPSVVKHSIKKIILEINSALHHYCNGISREHLVDICDRLKKVIDPNTPLLLVPLSNKGYINSLQRKEQLKIGRFISPYENFQRLNCWEIERQ